MMGTVTRVLGVDPGLNTTGYGVIDVVGGKVQLVEAGVIRSTAKLTLPERLQELFDGLSEVLTALNPHVMSIEQLYSHYERPTTAILMGHARGALLLSAAQRSMAARPLFTTSTSYPRASRPARCATRPTAARSRTPTRPW